VASRIGHRAHLLVGVCNVLGTERLFECNGHCVPTTTSCDGWFGARATSVGGVTLATSRQPTAPCALPARASIPQTVGNACPVSRAHSQSSQWARPRA
jgi:hypothetical protein